MNAQTKHTPGPWVHHPEDNIITVAHAGNGTCRLLEWTTRSLHVSIEERDANARLIAAAPELLEALVTFMAFIELPNVELAADLCLASNTIEKAQAAIAKATGAA